MNNIDKYLQTSTGRSVIAVYGARHPMNRTEGISEMYKQTRKHAHFVEWQTDVRLTPQTCHYSQQTEQSLSV